LVILFEVKQLLQSLLNKITELLLLGNV